MSVSYFWLLVYFLYIYSSGKKTRKEKKKCLQKSSCGGVLIKNVYKNFDCPQG